MSESTSALLPRDRDGRDINVGDTVFGDDGRAWLVCGVTVGMWARGVKNHVVHAEGDGGEWRDLNPEWLSHERPDSLERIADELEEWSEDNRVNGDDEIFSRAGEIAGRIRRLAAKDGE